MSARSGIVNALVDKLKNELNGTGNFVTNIFTNVGKQSKTFENINDFPYISITPGPEQREYQPSQITWADLTIYFRIYVNNNDDPQAELEQIISDLETFVDINQKISYNVTVPSGVEERKTVVWSITSITTDEGLLAPYGLAEVQVSVRYERERLI